MTKFRQFSTSSIGIILIYNPHRINLQIVSKFENDSQLTISVSGSTLH